MDHVEAAVHWFRVATPSVDSGNLRISRSALTKDEAAGFRALLMPDNEERVLVEQENQVYLKVELKHLKTLIEYLENGECDLEGLSPQELQQLKREAARLKLTNLDAKLQEIVPVEPIGGQKRDRAGEVLPPAPHHLAQVELTAAQHFAGGAGHLAKQKSSRKPRSKPTPSDGINNDILAHASSSNAANQHQGYLVGGLQPGASGLQPQGSQAPPMTAQQLANAGVPPDIVQLYQHSYGHQPDVQALLANVLANRDQSGAAYAYMGPQTIADAYQNIAMKSVPGTRVAHQGSAPAPAASTPTTTGTAAMGNGAFAAYLPRPSTSGNGSEGRSTASEGKNDLEKAYEQADIEGIEDPEERRKQRRLLKNRRSAASHRERKKAELQALQERVALLEAENSQLRYAMACRDHLQMQQVNQNAAATKTEAEAAAAPQAMQ